MSAVLAEIAGLGVAYGAGRRARAALAEVSFDLMAGERLAIIGESGSGKSTLALALAGLLPPGATRTGDIRWPGLGAPPRLGADLGMVFQDPGSSLNPVLSVGEQIAEVGHTHLGLSWREAFERAEALLARVHIPDPGRALHAFPHQLSGGQRQRVAIASAIAAGPSLLIADEATSALDTVVQAEIIALLDGLVHEDGMTLVFVTHDIALASRLATRIAVFWAGRLVEIGASRQVLEAPRAPYTAALLKAHIDLRTPRLVGDRHGAA